MDKCENVLCDSPAEYIDEMSNIICGECMQEEIENGDAVAEGFETLHQNNGQGSENES